MAPGVHTVCRIEEGWCRRLTWRAGVPKLIFMVFLMRPGVTTN